MVKILIFHCGVSHSMPQASPRLSHSSWLMLCTVVVCYLLFQHPFTSRQFFPIVSWPISILDIIASTWQWKTLTLDDVSVTTFIFMDFPARFDTGYPVLTLSKPQSSMVPLPSPGDPSVRQRTACCIGALSMRHSATRPLGRCHGSGATMLTAPPMVTLGHQTLDLGWENMMIYN